MNDKAKKDDKSVATLPEGVRDMLPVEAEAVERVERALMEVFAGYGFDRVITPLVEYADVIKVGFGGDIEGDLLKFIDPSTGKVVCLRPDITPQVARMVATRMREEPLPLKLCYNESVLRYAASRGKTREVIQAGVEYVSEEPSPEIDAEVVAVAIEALKKAGLTDFKVDLGDVGFVRAVMDMLGATLGSGDKKAKAAILKAVAVKDRPALEKLTENLGKADEGAKELLLALPGFYGEEEVLKKARGFKLSADAVAAIDNLDAVVTIINDKGYGDYITIDLGEVRGLDYYTGIIFEGFSSSLGSPILGGGRYDTLLGKYGYEAAATGFAFDVTSIVSITGK